MNKLDFAAINDALNLAAVVPQWLPGGDKRGHEYVVANPTRNDRNPGSFTINLVKGVWKDYATGDGGADLVSLYAYLFHGNDQGAAARELAGNHGVRIGDTGTRQRAHEAKVRRIEEAKPEPVMPVPDSATQPTFHHPRWGKPAMRWDYLDAEGRLLLYVCRFDPEGERKQVVPYSWCKHPDGAERWTWRGITGQAKRPLYGLDRLAAMPDADVILVEGEKTADAGQALMGDAAVVVTWMGGVETADRASLRQLKGRRVILWPDFDAQRDRETGELLQLHEQPGMRAMMHHAQALKSCAREVIMVGYMPDEGPHGWDLADALAEGWDRRQVLQHIRQNAGDPWRIASGKPLAALPVPANDNAPAAMPMDAAVNPYGFPHMSDKGQPLNTRENLEYVLDGYGITVRYNEITKKVDVRIPGFIAAADTFDNAALSEILSICARNRMPQSNVPGYMSTISGQNPHNPVRDWIMSNPWDGVSRFDALAATIEPAEGYPAEMRDALLRRWLISAVAAAFKPDGFEAHGALVFTGPQGTGKTRWFKRLAPADSKLVLVGATLDPANKDTIITAVSHWLVELGELDATFRKADIARLKSFITQSVDKVRKPYDRLDSEMQRRTVFCASVNEANYLVDDTGNRRWWTVAVKRMDYQHTIDMQQLWAEVLTWFQAGEQWHLTPEENARLGAINEGHEQSDPIAELILAGYDPKAPEVSHMSASEVLRTIGYNQPSSGQAAKAGKALAKLGFRKSKNEGRQGFWMPRRRNDGWRRDDDDGRPF